METRASTTSHRDEPLVSCMAADYVVGDSKHPGALNLNHYSAMTKLLLAILVTVFAYPAFSTPWNGSPEVPQSRAVNAVLADHNTVSGTWTGSLENWDDKELDDVIYLSLQRRSRKGMSQSGNMYRLQDLSGLQIDMNNDELLDVSFLLNREAGKFEFAGRFDALVGAGTFRFNHDPRYVESMAALGYDSLDEDKLFSLALHDVSTAFIRELRDLGYASLPLEKLEAMRIHSVSPGFLREMESLGFGMMSPDRAIEFRIHDVSPSYIKAIRIAGFDDISMKQLVSFRIHDITPAFAASFTSAGYKFPSADQLVELGIHKVQATFAAEMVALGFDRPSLKQLVSLRIHRVSTEYIQGLTKLGLKNVSIDELVSLNIHGVSLGYIEKLQAVGLSPNADQLTRLKIHGISADEAKAYMGS